MGFSKHGGNITFYRLILKIKRAYLDGQLGAHSSPIEKMDPYIRLHQFLHWLWKILDRDKTYMGIPRHLELI